MPSARRMVVTAWSRSLSLRADSSRLLHIAYSHTLPGKGVLAKARRQDRRRRSRRRMGRNRLDQDGCDRATASHAGSKRRFRVVRGKKLPLWASIKSGISCIDFTPPAREVPSGANLAYAADSRAGVFLPADVRSLGMPRTEQIAIAC